MLFYCTYIGEVVGKAMRECGCCTANIDIGCYVIFREAFKRIQQLITHSNQMD